MRREDGSRPGIETPLTRLLAASVPIQLAAMPGISTPGLVAAVSEAGGVGMLPAPLLSVEELERSIDDVVGRTSGAFGVNFLVPFLDRECLALAARRSRLVELFYGDPDPELVDLAHASGALVSWQVGSIAEALAAQRAGCDVVVVQGTEAGGHVRGRTSLLPLLSQVLEVASVPVVAAGGLSTARDLAAVLACGASGARMGTRFVAAAESGAHPVYVKTLLAASAADTCLTEAFAVGWPDAPHRVLRSSLAAAEALSDDVVGEMRVAERGVPVPRLSVMCPSVATTGRVEAMALYAGESVEGVTSVRPAGELVAEIAAGARELLERAPT